MIAFWNGAPVPLTPREAALCVLGGKRFYLPSEMHCCRWCGHVRPEALAKQQQHRCPHGSGWWELNVGAFVQAGLQSLHGVE